ANAVAGIDQYGKTKREIGLRRELLNNLRLLVLDDVEILFGEVGDKAPFFVGDGKQDVHASHVENNSRWVVGLARTRGGLLGLRRGFLGYRFPGDNHRHQTQTRTQGAEREHFHMATFYRCRRTGRSCPLCAIRKTHRPLVSVVRDRKNKVDAYCWGSEFTYATRLFMLAGVRSGQ